MPKVKVVVPPKLEIAKIEPTKIQPSKPGIELPKIVKLDLPKPVLNIPPAPPKAVAPPPAPKVGMFASAKPTPVANSQTRAQATMGGFGNPQGVAPNPNANRAATIVALGSFNAASGTDGGAGAARRGTVQGVDFGAGVKNGVPAGTSHGAVASAGFANDVVGGTGKPGGHGRVVSASFWPCGGWPFPCCKWRRLLSRRSRHEPSGVSFLPNMRMTCSGDRFGRAPSDCYRHAAQYRTWLEKDSRGALCCWKARVSRISTSHCRQGDVSK